MGFRTQRAWIHCGCIRCGLCHATSTRSTYLAQQLVGFVHGDLHNGNVFVQAQLPSVTYAGFTSFPAKNRFVATRADS